MRLSDHEVSFQDYKVDTTLTEQRDVKQEALSPHGSRGLPLSTAIIASRMDFSYPRFNGETDAVSHIRLFLNVWNANHMAQQFPEAEAHASKVAKFRLWMVEQRVGTLRWTWKQ